MKYYAIIPAGGSGSRMQSDIPKQFMLLAGKPVLMHTIKAFYDSQLNPEIILALNKDRFAYWEELCRRHDFNVPHKLTEGGIQRFDSVKNALNEITETDSIVAVHDAARPVISNELITRCFLEAEEKGSAVCGVQSRDSVRQLQGDRSAALNRENIFLVQTPQVFLFKTLRNAYQQNYLPEFTDDASVVEKAGYTVSLVPGDYRNIKITFPEDIETASLYLKKRAFKKA